MITPRRTLVLCITVLLALAPLSASAVGKPLIERYGDSATGEVAGHCGPEYGDFDMLSTHTVRFRDEYIFRADGTWERLIENEQFDGTLTNSVTGRTVIEGPDRLLWHIEFADDGLATSWDTATITSLTLAGQDFHTVIRGEGRVVHDAGIVYVERINDVLTVVGWHGRHDVNASQNQVAFEPVYCPILAGN